MPLSGLMQIREILAALEARPWWVAIIDCPWCEAQEMLELDPRGRAYWCRACGRHGPLAHLARFAEAEFLARHRETVRLMREPGRDAGGGL